MKGCLPAVAVGVLLHLVLSTGNRADAQTTQPTTRPVVNLDFSQNHLASQLTWPETGKYQRYQGCLYRVNGYRRIKVAEGKIVEGQIETLRASRNKDRLIVVSVTFGNETAQSLNQHVRELARLFEVPTTKIDAWWNDLEGATQRRDAVLSCRHDTNPTIDLEIRPGYNEERPWFLLFTIGWLEEMPEPVRPATQAAPPPRSRGNELGEGAYR